MKFLKAEYVNANFVILHFQGRMPMTVVSDNNSAVSLATELLTDDSEHCNEDTWVPQMELKKDVA